MDTSLGTRSLGSSAFIIAILVSSSTVVFLPDLLSQGQLQVVYAAAPAGFSDRLVAGGLNLPTAMEFAPDGRIFVSEKDGALRVIKDGVLLAQPFASLSVNSEGERGLLGIAFDPDFESNGYVYVYYTTSAEPIHNRVSRLTADPSDPDVMLAGSERPILDLEPVATVSHNGGALAFGPDGMLYISTGDNYYPHLAQSLTSRFGKILRINADGTVPTDNPFYNVQGAYGEIWALGLRNPFTFQFSPASGDGGNGSLMYINDVGQDSWEEINMGARGANYGWPLCEGFCNDSQFTDPVYAYPHPTNGRGSSITGGAFYEGADQFPPEYRGSYFFGDYTRGFISRLPPSSNEAVPFLTDINSPVDIRVGPEGYLYYLSIGAGQVRSVLHTTPGNYDPIAVANANQTSGLPPLTVAFDGSASSDPNSEDTLSYSWDFGDGSDPVTDAQVTHVYEETGPYAATLTVTDGRGGVSSDTIEITVGIPPVGTIDTPAEGTMYNAGDTISFSGSASDSEDGGEELPASAFEWTILFHHNIHTHPFREFSGVSSGSFTIPTVGETDDDVWYRIYLTVTDSSGLTHQSTRDILPNKSTITVASNVDGVEILVDGQPHPTPHSFVGVVGAERTIEAPAVHVLDGVLYHFGAWSDDDDDDDSSSERIRTVVTPPSGGDNSNGTNGTTLTALYSAGFPASEHTLTVNSADLEGNVRTGHYTTIEHPRGTILQEGYTPLNFTALEGTNYTVIIRDYRNSTFSHWEDGSTGRVRTVALSDDTTITAHYRTINGTSGTGGVAPDTPAITYELTVDSADLEGNILGGHHVIIESSDDGTVMHEGDTPLNYTSADGNSYTIIPQDTEEMVFNHWEDGSTVRDRTIVIDSDTALIAHYENVVQEQEQQEQEQQQEQQEEDPLVQEGVDEEEESTTPGVDEEEEESPPPSSGGGGATSGGGGGAGGGATSGGGAGGGATSGGGAGGGATSGGGAGGGATSGGGDAVGASGNVLRPGPVYPASYFVTHPLEKVQLQRSNFIGIFSGDRLSEARSGEQIAIAISFRNYQQSEQNYAMIVQIENSQGFTTDIGWVQGSFDSGEIANAARTWTAGEQDSYTIKIFIWDGVGPSPTALSEVTTRSFSVS